MDVREEIVSRLSIEDIIGEYVTLKRSGRNFKGLSPFTNEKTPSFTVSPEKQIWKDFSSGKGGSVFDFVMEMEGMDFKGALELLARKAGVDLEQYQSSPRRSGPDKKRLEQLLESATKFYQVQFSKHREALEYVFKVRHFTKETALTWCLGYAPNTGQALCKFLIDHGFNERELKQAGVVSQAYGGGIQDMFRGRLMIPLQDSQGKVIGFTARLLSQENKAPKYINTPQTVLYDKSRHIYGLHEAKEAIRQNNYVVIVEGNLDVISSHQVGVKQVVATAGTALTEQHLKVLGRFTNDIRLCFDADRAGLMASERAITLASRARLSLGIVSLPTAKDPDELIQKDRDAWKKTVGNAQYALDWLIERHSTLLDLTSGPGKRKFSDILLPLVRSLTDPVERDHYLNRLAEILKVSKSALDQKYQTASSLVSRTSHKSTKAPSAVDYALVAKEKLQDRFLALLLLRQTLRDLLELVSPQMLYTEPGKRLLELMKKRPSLTSEDASRVQSLADYVKIETLLYEELYEGLELNELHDEATRLQAELVTTYVKTQKKQLSEKLQESDNEQVLSQLRQQDKRYNELLNKVKGKAYG
jgi:DNA primase